MRELCDIMVTESNSNKGTSSPSRATKDSFFVGLFYLSFVARGLLGWNGPTQKLFLRIWEVT